MPLQTSPLLPRRVFSHKYFTSSKWTLSTRALHMAARLPCDFLQRGMCLVGHMSLNVATCIQMCPMIPCVPNNPQNSLIQLITQSLRWQLLTMTVIFPRICFWFFLRWSRFQRVQCSVLMLLDSWNLHAHTHAAGILWVFVLLLLFDWIWWMTVACQERQKNMNMKVSKSLAKCGVTWLAIMVLN